MRNTFFLLLFIFASLISTGQVNTTTGFTTGKSGLEYKVISTGTGAMVENGNFMQMHFSNYYNNGIIDSVLDDSRKTGAPVIEKLDSASIPPSYYEIFRMIRNTDSVVMRILTDSIFKDKPDQMPPFFKKGAYVYTTVKVLNVFTSLQQADSARTAILLEKKRTDSIDAITEFAVEDKILNDYFAKNNIIAVKAPKGTYISIIKKGTGANASTKDKVKLNYTGRNFAGKVFDSNTDIAFKHVEPFEVDLSVSGTVIPGWEEGLLFLNKGSKAVLYVPSPLAWGKEGAGGDIGPNEILMFDIEMLSIEPSVAVAKPAARPTAKPAAKKNKPVSKPKTTTKKAGK